MTSLIDCCKIKIDGLGSFTNFNEIWSNINNSIKHIMMNNPLNVDLVQKVKVACPKEL